MHDVRQHVVMPHEISIAQRLGKRCLCQAEDVLAALGAIDATGETYRGGERVVERAAEAGFVAHGRAGAAWVEERVPSDDIAHLESVRAGECDDGRLFVHNGQAAAQAAVVDIQRDVRRRPWWWRGGRRRGRRRGRR